MDGWSQSRKKRGKKKTIELRAHLGIEVATHVHLCDVTGTWAGLGYFSVCVIAMVFMYLHSCTVLNSHFTFLFSCLTFTTFNGVYLCCLFIYFLFFWIVAHRIYKKKRNETKHQQIFVWLLRDVKTGHIIKHRKLSISNWDGEYGFNFPFFFLMESNDFIFLFFFSILIMFLFFFLCALFIWCVLLTHVELTIMIMTIVLFFYFLPFYLIFQFSVSKKKKNFINCMFFLSRLVRSISIFRQ